MSNKNNGLANYANERVPKFYKDTGISSLRWIHRVKTVWKLVRPEDIEKLPPEQVELVQTRTSKKGKGPQARMIRVEYAEPGAVRYFFNIPGMLEQIEKDLEVQAKKAVEHIPDYKKKMINNGIGTGAFGIGSIISMYTDTGAEILGAAMPILNSAISDEAKQYIATGALITGFIAFARTLYNACSDYHVLNKMQYVLDHQSELSTLNTTPEALEWLKCELGTEALYGPKPVGLHNIGDWEVKQLTKAMDWADQTGWLDEHGYPRVDDPDILTHQQKKKSRFEKRNRFKITQ